jgi:tetratricopeptide (TPR) repeat protein
MRVQLAIAALVSLGTTSALAAGAGGGASLPSASAPSYDPAAEYAKGVEAYQAADYKAADKAFRKVLAAVPRDGAALLFAGMTKTALGDYKAAAKTLEKAVKVDPQSIPARREYAIALKKLGDARAEAELADLKARATSCADTCPQANDLKTAISAVEATSASAPTAALTQPPAMMLAGSSAGDSAYRGAVALINQGQYTAAIAELRAAAEAFGPHPDVLTYIGYSYRKLGQFDRAETYYRQALAIAPDHLGATEYYGELKAERGDIAGARAMLAKLERQCRFGCIEAEDLRRWIDARAG